MANIFYRSYLLIPSNLLADGIITVSDAAIQIVSSSYEAVISSVGGCGFKKAEV
jgi:hypothetical protein